MAIKVNSIIIRYLVQYSLFSFVNIFLGRTLEVVPNSEPENIQITSDDFE